MTDENERTTGDGESIDPTPNATLEYRPAIIHPDASTTATVTVTNLAESTLRDLIDLPPRHHLTEYDPPRVVDDAIAGEVRSWGYELVGYDGFTIDVSFAGTTEVRFDVELTGTASFDGPVHDDASGETLNVAPPLSPNDTDETESSRAGDDDGDRFARDGVPTGQTNGYRTPDPPRPRRRLPSANLGTLVGAFRKALPFERGGRR